MKFNDATVSGQPTNALRLLALVVFFGVIPTLTFYLGTKYQKAIEVRALESAFDAQEYERPIEGGVGKITYTYIPETIDSSLREKKETACKGGSVADQELCSKIQLVEADEKLSGVFASVLSSAIEYGRNSQGDASKVESLARKFVASQKSWTALKGELCEVESFLSQDATIPAVVIVNNCKTDLIKLRTEVLSKYQKLFSRGSLSTNTPIPEPQ
jgi:uncharacterized protein YecT (DUF1311 family)